MATAVASVTDLCLAAKAAARPLAAAPSAVKDAALRAIAQALEARVDEILEANARDLDAGRANGLGEALMDRLALDDEPRRTTAFPDFRHSAAASIVTFGRAS